MESLATEQGIHCRGYTDLAEAIAAETPDVVALCSPFGFHAAQLELIAAANCHCLVEKPLAWPAAEEEVSSLINHFGQKDLLLQLVGQWPQTLSAFSRLHGPLPQRITDFAMGLSPISIGPNMVPDSAPHFISMLQALLGPGQCEQVRITLSEYGPEGPEQLALECHYAHQSGRCRAQLMLATCEQRPRPAWYQINQLRVDREVQLPQYTQQLVAGDNSATMNDPMEGVVGHFLSSLAINTPTDTASLLQGHKNLVQLASAWPN